MISVFLFYFMYRDILMATVETKMIWLCFACYLQEVSPKVLLKHISGQRMGWSSNCKRKRQTCINVNVDILTMKKRFFVNILCSAAFSLLCKMKQIPALLNKVKKKFRFKLQWQILPHCHLDIVCILNMNYYTVVK